MRSRLSPQPAVNIIRKNSADYITLKAGHYLIVVQEKETATVSALHLVQEENVFANSKQLKLVGKANIGLPEGEFIAIKLT